MASPENSNLLQELFGYRPAKVVTANPARGTIVQIGKYVTQEVRIFPGPLATALAQSAEEGVGGGGLGDLSRAERNPSRV